ncbi:hypothetical protein F751_2395 [Auxenochlorella protothecoides]|uniref:Uncharacterized protein n=1 Tax=Auxenochlorella protothecoides TaxID=3075 RepID=A0A087SG24_AUXPR|nr:hypothetical protein F751_2395 [Auxenochlorella protothecoides]KFM24678.1 hypothetical protein F751_2395 [Auxenochlorella protothecoides]
MVLLRDDVPEPLARQRLVGIPRHPSAPPPPTFIHEGVAPEGALGVHQHRSRVPLEELRSQHRAECGSVMHKHGIHAVGRPASSGGGCVGGNGGGSEG